MSFLLGNLVFGERNDPDRHLLVIPLIAGVFIVIGVLFFIMIASHKQQHTSGLTPNRATRAPVIEINGIQRDDISRQRSPIKRPQELV